MKRNKTDKTATRPRREEGKGLFLIGFSLLFLISLLSFELHSPGKNWLGLIGYYTAFSLNYTFGLCSFLLAGFSFWYGWKKLMHKEIVDHSSKLFYFVLFIISTAFLLNLYAETGGAVSQAIARKVYTESVAIEFPYPHESIRYNLGGSPLYFLYRDFPTINLQTLLSDVGVGLTFSLTAIVSFLLMTGIKVIPLFKGGIERLLALLGKLKSIKMPTLKLPAKKERPKLVMEMHGAAGTLEKTPRPVYSPQTGLPPKKVSKPEKKESDNHIPQAGSLPTQKGGSTQKPPRPTGDTSGDFTAYHIPPPSLLSEPKKVDHPQLKKELNRQAEILEETLSSFGIEAKVGEIHSGPTITSFEVQPSVGVKVQKIKALENDIALNLQAKSTRIIAPIPGKAAVGVEIPSLFPQAVSFREMLETYQNEPNKLSIPVILGKSVSGENVMSDLAKMPHCIIAGATGSGKSVCINAIILSILMNARPDEVKLLMVDPKKVELSAYTHLPHMIAPVITEANGAYAALNWLVKEMQDRYDLLKQLGLRNIGAFNSRTIDHERESELSRDVPEKLPFIVAIIDEFADLMMVSSADIETPIARIAQMARAVGIHLILATQRPSREVITGLIKANFPTRISFKVSSRVNSQIIIDDTGAETLLGNGDMLFLPPGTSTLMRAQGAYISDDEINRIIRFITKQSHSNYLIKSFDQMTHDDTMILMGKEGGSEPKDSLYEEAMKMVIETQTASTTFLQRKLKIGYARAASLMDELESSGIVGPAEGSKPRQILRSSPVSDQPDMLDNMNPGGDLP